MAIDLEQSLLDGGTRFVNFFEGRILTGRDLREEQTASRSSRKALGEAIGAGVVWGLEVADATPGGPLAKPAVSVSGGLALNWEGQTLKLSESRVVRLSELASGDPRRSVGAFHDCDDQPSGSASPTAEGFHILTIAPASGFEEEAPKSGLGEEGAASGCGRRYSTLGLRFRLVPVDPALLAGGPSGAISTDAALSQLRNHVAHLGLGTAMRRGFAFDPFARLPDGGSAWAEWGLVDTLRSGDEPALGDCEVPLAMLRLSGGQLSFVDMWTVRRRPNAGPQDADWPLVASAARSAADEATLFQFQRHIDWLFGRLANPSATVGTAYFRHLPAVGLLPLTSAATFLQDQTPPLALSPERLLPIIEEALAYPAVDLSTSPPPRFCTFKVPGTDWTLFVSDMVPSAEKAAEKCAELERRIEQIEGDLQAPGQIAGTVLFSFSVGVGTITAPFPGVVIRATAEDSTETLVTTDDAGRYSITLPPGVYELVPVHGDQVLSGRAVGGIVVNRGDNITQNFTIRNSDLVS